MRFPGKVVPHFADLGVVDADVVDGSYPASGALVGRRCSFNVVHTSV